MIIYRRDVVEETTLFVERKPASTILCYVRETPARKFPYLKGLLEAGMDHPYVSTSCWQIMEGNGQEQTADMEKSSPYINC